MGRYHEVRILDIIFQILWAAAFFSHPLKITGIRKDVSIPKKLICRNTVQGRYKLADDNGYICTALSVSPWTRCCPESGERFSCLGCNLISKCCNSYEYCVSCCLNPSMTQEELVLKLKIAKPLTAGTHSSIFDFCSGRCRHNSANVVHENAYSSDFHHCYISQTNSSGLIEPNFERRLTGIDIIIGKQGESCNLACISKGQSCVSNKLSVINSCELLEKYMRCKGSCFASMGADQPAEVVNDAPKHMFPGACLYSQTDGGLSCEGFHPQTKRLCPCA